LSKNLVLFLEICMIQDTRSFGNVLIYKKKISGFKSINQLTSYQCLYCLKILFYFWKYDPRYM